MPNLILGIFAGAGLAKPIVTGGTLFDDSTYFYRLFTGNGTLGVTTGNLSADVLIVAGGGGGGGQNPGGPGGAGGLRAFASQVFEPKNYTVSIGAGGTATSTDGTQGGNTEITATGFTTLAVSGGGRGLVAFNNGVAGGSGSGGSAYYVGANGTGGAGNVGGYSPVEGYAGGTATNSGGGNFVSAGGGGAGGVGGGAASNGNTGGAGGVGTDTYNSINFSSWLSATSTGVSGKLAGGGGGGIYTGTAGSGVNGGGNGGVNGAATAGATNSGGGGGSGFPGAAGGSGLVIIRYLKSAV